MSGKSDKRQNTPQDQSNTIKDPDDWTTGEEPMTGAQESYLHTLATEAGFSVSPIGPCSDPLALIEAQQRSQVQLAP